MRLYRYPKYRNKTSLHVSENFRSAAIDPELPPAVPVKGRGNKESALYTCLGFLFMQDTHVDVQDYFDFHRMTWYLLDLRSDLKFEALPTGLLIRCPNGEVRIVVESQLYPLDERLEAIMPPKEEEA